MLSRIVKKTARLMVLASLAFFGSQSIAAAQYEYHSVLPGTPSSSSFLPGKADLRYLDVYRRVLADRRESIEKRHLMCVLIGKLGNRAKAAAPELLDAFKIPGPAWELVDKTGFQGDPIHVRLRGTDCRRTALWALQAVGAEGGKVLPALVDCLAQMEKDADAASAELRSFEVDNALGTVVVLEGNREVSVVDLPSHFAAKFSTLGIDILKALERYGDKARTGIPVLTAMAKRQALASQESKKDDIPGVEREAAPAKELLWVDPKCQCAAIRLLGAIAGTNDPDAVAALHSIAALDRDASLRSAAEAALQQIERRGEISGGKK